MASFLTPPGQYCLNVSDSSKLTISWCIDGHKPLILPREKFCGCFSFVLLQKIVRIHCSQVILQQYFQTFQADFKFFSKSNISAPTGPILKFLDIFPMFLRMGNPFFEFLGSLHTSKLHKMGKTGQKLMFLMYVWAPLAPFAVICGKIWPHGPLVIYWGQLWAKGQHCRPLPSKVIRLLVYAMKPLLFRVLFGH